MALSKRHFAQIARIIGQIRDRDERCEIAIEFAEYLASENPRFDFDRFARAVEWSASERVQRAASQRIADPDSCLLPGWLDTGIGGL